MAIEEARIVAILLIIIVFITIVFITGIYIGKKIGSKETITYCFSKYDDTAKKKISKDKEGDV